MSMKMGKQLLPLPSCLMLNLLELKAKQKWQLQMQYVEQFLGQRR
jgi:hypothetical protein